MLPSPMTLKYLEAQRRQGEKFDYDVWFRGVQEERAREINLAKSKCENAWDAADDKGEFKRPASSIRDEYQLSALTFPLRAPLRVAEKRKESSLFKAILRVTDAWGEFQSSRARDAIYVYLRSVYALVLRYRGERRRSRLLRRATKFAGLPYDEHADPFATIVRCTSEGALDAKTISKLARALKYVASRNRPPRMLRSFIKRLGGINGCADQYAKYLGRAAK